MAAAPRCAQLSCRWVLLHHAFAFILLKPVPGDFCRLPPYPRHSLARSLETHQLPGIQRATAPTLSGPSWLEYVYRFALGLGLGRLSLGGIASQVRFCPQLSPPFRCFFVVCQVLQSFSYLNFYSCILYVVS